MATGKDVFRRNGHELSWSSFTLKVLNEEFFGTVGVDYEEKLERAFARGIGQVPRGTTRGQYSVEGSVIKFHKGTGASFLEFLAQRAADGKSYGTVKFFGSLQYVENDISITEELYDCQVSGRKVSVAQGADPLLDEYPITVLYAKLTTPNIAGMTLFDNTKGRY